VNAVDGMPDEAADRAARLLRWYPAPWRIRYGEEFTELLIADIRERPRSAARTLDVARGVVVARLADACAIAAAATLVRRTEFAPRLLAFEARLGTLACAVMAVLLAGRSCWVATGGQRTLFHAGLIDIAGVTMMALALGIAQQAARTARLGLGFAGR